MRWKIGQAKQRFSEVIRRASAEPQFICNRNRIVAAVVDASAFEKLRTLRDAEGKRSLAQAFEEFRAVAKRERYRLAVPPRRNRRNAFADVPR